jgi:hypothetical protein
MQIHFQRHVEAQICRFITKSILYICHQCCSVVQLVLYLSVLFFSKSVKYQVTGILLSWSYIQQLLFSNSSVNLNVLSLLFYFVAYLMQIQVLNAVGMILNCYHAFILWKTKRLNHTDVLFVDGVSDSSKEPKNDEECSICLQLIIPSQRWKVGCKHTFHYECIREYVSSFWSCNEEQKEVKCPLCRKKLNVIRCN